MIKKTSFSTKGQRADIGDLPIYRLLPNRYADAVGPFVFLDHIGPTTVVDTGQGGTGAHAHRGIATLTYVLEGEDEHFDSAGNNAMVYSGGVQWMNAGNGIMHDETLNPDSTANSAMVHACQFWINLPPDIKAEKPAYLSLQADQIPVAPLAGMRGQIKVILGSYNGFNSIIPSYSEQFLYHVQLHAGEKFDYTVNENIEIAAVLLSAPVTVNNEMFEPGEFVEFDREPGVITLFNHHQDKSDVLLFGGQTYKDPIVADGPFVMNSLMEIATAYKDLAAGKYGKIFYNRTGDQAKNVAEIKG